MIELQQIDFPSDCTVIHHDFYNYDPEKNFNESDNLDYLYEDLLQCKFEENNMIIDLGWYGNIAENKGGFKIQMIKDQNWEIPFNVVHSKSVDETMEILIKILNYYTSTEVEAEDV
jgi:hypothetical protein